MKRVLKLVLSLALVAASLLYPNAINATIDLEDGLYAYVGTEDDPTTDTNKNNFLSELEVPKGQTKNVIFCLVDSGVVSCVDPGKTEFFGSGMQIDGSGDVFIITCNKNFASYMLEYPVDDTNKYFLRIKDTTTIEKGFYAYIGSDNPRLGSPQEYVSTLDVQLDTSKSVVLCFADCDAGQTFTIIQNGAGVTFPEDLDYEFKNDSTFLTPTNGEKTTYEIKYTENQVDYTLTLNCTAPDPIDGPRNGDGSGIPGYKIGTTKYYFGLAEWNEESLTNSYGVVDWMDLIYRENEPFEFSMILGAGTSKGPSEVAPEDVFGMIEDPSVELVFDTIGDKASVTLRSSKIMAYERMCYCFDIVFAPGAVGTTTLKTSFKLNLGGGNYKDLVSYQTFEINKQQSINVDLAEDDMEPETFNTLFSSLSKLAEMKHINFDHCNDLIVHLPQGNFSGIYRINLDAFNSTNYTKKCKFVGNTAQDGTLKTTINGTIEVNGGVVNIESINFKANSTCTINVPALDIASKTVGVVARKLQDETKKACSTWVDFCTFDGYDYAVLCTHTGWISVVREDVFSNCDYGYYMDCRNHDPGTGGDGCTYNTFINIKTAAVTIASLPQMTPVYSLRFNNNYFFNNLSGNGYSDFSVFVDGETDHYANYYFTYNYYGKKPNEKTFSNNRSAAVNYNGKENARVYTNPCIKYPETTIPFGIDDKNYLYTAVFKGVKVTLNKHDEKKLGKAMIASADGKTALGGIRFE